MSLRSAERKMDAPTVRRGLASCAAIACLVLVARPAGAESGVAAWLRYPPITDAALRSRYGVVSGSVVVLGDSLVARTARDEVLRGVESMLARRLTAAPPGAADVGIVLGTREQIGQTFPAVAVPALMRPDAFWLGTSSVGTRRVIVVAGRGDRGVLYGVFALLRRIALHEPVDALDERQEPAAPVRWVNEWNNLDGSIERGYAGASIFFDHDSVARDLTRVREYGRLLASVGVNGCAVNNVNANARVISHAFIPELARLADAFRPWGVSLAVSVDFSSPMTIGALNTFDPLDPRVVAFWKARIDDIFQTIPDLGGVVLGSRHVVLDQRPSLEHGDLGGVGTDVDAHQVAPDRAPLSLATPPALGGLGVGQGLVEERRLDRLPGGGTTPSAASPPAPGRGLVGRARAGGRGTRVADLGPGGYGLDRGRRGFEVERLVRARRVVGRRARGCLGLAGCRRARRAATATTPRAAAAPLPRRGRRRVVRRLRRRCVLRRRRRRCCPFREGGEQGLGLERPARRGRLLARRVVGHVGHVVPFS